MTVGGAGTSLRTLQGADVETLGQSLAYGVAGNPQDGSSAFLSYARDASDDPTRHSAVGHHSAVSRTCVVSASSG
jgi:hypothetical protein